MTKKIFKYQLSATALSVVSMPLGAKVLSCQTQRGKVVVWALVDTALLSVNRVFLVVGTGWELEPENAATLERATFIGTVQLNDGFLVLHVFDAGER